MKSKPVRHLYIPCDRKMADNYDLWEDLRQAVLKKNDIKKVREILDLKNLRYFTKPDNIYVVLLLLVKAMNCRGNKEIIELFLSFLKLANINFTTADLEKYRIILKGNIRLTESFLKKSGKKVEAPEWDLHLLVNCVFHEKIQQRSRKEMLLLLMNYGFDITGYRSQMKGNLLQRLIQVAQKRNDNDAIETAEFLINFGLSMTEFDTCGLSALTYSVLTKNVSLISLLTKKGADLNQMSRQGTPLYVAVNFNQKNTVEFLLSNGADINAKNRSEGTALHVACLRHFKEMIDLLISRGADINAEAANGMTPFSVLTDSEPNGDGYLASYRFRQCVILMVKEFSKLCFENIKICDRDMRLILEKAPEHFAKCKAELEQMASTNFYGSHSFYSILRKSLKIQNLAHLTKNEELASKFKANLHRFLYYQNDLKLIWEEAVREREKFELVNFRLYSVFGNSFPDVVVRKISKNIILEELP